MNKFKILLGASALLFTALANATPVFTSSGYSSSLIGNGTTNGYGSAVTTSTDDIYFTSGGNGQIYKVDSTGTQTVFAVTSGLSMGLTIDSNTLYAGNTSGNITAYDLNTSIGSTFTSLSGSINGLVLANSNSDYFGSILAATYSGLYAVDTATGLSSLIDSGLYNGVDVTQGGDIFATKDNGVSHFLSDGTLDYFTNTSYIDGITIHDGTGDIYLASSQQRSILQFDELSLATSVFASNINFDGGWFPSPIEFSQNGEELYYGERDGSMWSIQGFPAISNSGTVPEPSILALMSLGIFGLGLSRRKMKK